MTQCEEYAVQEHFSEECGVVGVYNNGDIDTMAMYFALHALQHRGQESAGMAVTDGKTVIYCKHTGLVNTVFTKARLERMSGKKAGIGHVRYSTKGHNTTVNAQPLVASFAGGDVAVAHNGTLLNTLTLKKQLAMHGSIFQTQTDSEVFLHLIAHYAGDGMTRALEHMMKDVQGSYALTVLTRDRLYGVRDPYGIRPLCIGKKGGSYVLASESAALDALGAKLVRDVCPGEIVEIGPEGLKSNMVKNRVRPAGMCLFEYVYLARTDSIMDGIDIMGARLRAGMALAQVLPVDADLIAGVPDSALTAAMGYSRSSGIPYGDALVKNRYVGRSFIQPEQSLRELAVRMKLNALKANVEGKRVVLVDDSIVRGTTSKRLVDILKNAGAKEVHLRISSPPVNYPCYLGIDTPSRRQLISAGHSVEEICAMTGADSLAYLPLDGLIKAVCENDGPGFCTGCFNGGYPMNIRTCKNKGMCRINK